MPKKRTPKKVKYIGKPKESLIEIEIDDERVFFKLSNRALKMIKCGFPIETDLLFNHKSLKCVIKHTECSN